MTDPDWVPLPDDPADWDFADLDVDDVGPPCGDPDCTCHDLDDLLAFVAAWTTLTPNPRYL